MAVPEKADGSVSIVDTSSSQAQDTKTGTIGVPLPPPPQKHGEDLNRVFMPPPPTKSPKKSSAATKITPPNVAKDIFGGGLKKHNSILSNEDDVLDISRAFSKGEDFGTIVTDKKINHPPFSHILKAAFLERARDFKETLSKLHLLREEESVIEAAEVRKEIIREASTPSKIAPRDDYELALKKLTQRKPDARPPVVKPIIARKKPHVSIAVPELKSRPQSESERRIITNADATIAIAPVVTTQKTYMPATGPKEPVLPAYAQMTTLNVTPPSSETITGLDGIHYPEPATHTSEIVPPSSPTQLKTIAEILHAPDAKPAVPMQHPTIVTPAPAPYTPPKLSTAQSIRTTNTTPEPIRQQPTPVTQTPAPERASDSGWSHYIDTDAVTTPSKTPAPVTVEPVPAPLMPPAPEPSIETELLPEPVESIPETIPPQEIMTTEITTPLDIVESLSEPVTEPAPEIAEIITRDIEEPAPLPELPAEDIPTLPITPEVATPVYPWEAQANQPEPARLTPFPQKHTIDPEQLKWYALGAIGIVLLCGIVVLFLTISRPSKETVVETPAVPTFLNADVRIPLPLEGDRNSFFASLKAAGESGSGITQVYPTITTTEGAVVPARSSEILKLIKLNIDDTFSRSLKDDMVFGYVGEGTRSPFIIMRAPAFDTAFAGMLAWETQIATDLEPLFGEISGTSFTDAVQNNKSIRVLYNAKGEEEIMYGFVHYDLVVITTSSEALSAIISHL